jgi:hypothetical protein
MNKNDTSTKTTTLADLRNAGYEVDIRHNRIIDYANVVNGKLVIGKAFMSVPEFRAFKGTNSALRARGGRTDVTVTDPETKLEFYGYGICCDGDNYNKKDGIDEALKRVTALMLVCDGKDGFKCRLQV